MLRRAAHYGSVACALLLAVAAAASATANAAPTDGPTSRPATKASSADASPVSGDPALPGVARVDQALTSKLAKADARRRSNERSDVPEEAPAYVNRLALESSPYLLQHAHNPVNWYAWGDEPFERAAREHKPVLLSIGYSTCHWCHVMEHESFENEEIARFINETFVAIKVDREERPDIDAVYMNAVQLLTGRGGWPMTLALTADRKPFFGATYIPAHDGERGARKGFLTILRELSDAYRTDPNGVAESAAQLSRRIAEESRERPSADVPDVEAVRRAVSSFRDAFDPVNGGFGRAPKFPRPAVYELLLHDYHRAHDPKTLAIVVRSLDRMAAGGIYDHVGGGFHRYSTDAKWLVPHFEKMLYDNAQLVSVYLDAYQVTGRTDFADIARQTLEYLVREMASPQGAYYAATDADSRAPDGEMKEGWYFTWSPTEIEQAVGHERAQLVRTYFGVTDRGNLEGRSILHSERSIDEVAREFDMDAGRTASDIEAARSALYRARIRRSPPFLDDKVVASWNGLAISAFAKAAFVLDEADDAQHARAAAEFVLTHMRAADGTLSRTFREGRGCQPATLDDYAFVVQGLLDLYESVWEQRWLRSALELQSVQDARYFDDEAGAYFMTAHAGEALLTRPKPQYDGAEPSGNSVAAMNLLRLAEITSDDTYRRRAESIFRTFGATLRAGSPAVPALFSALDFYLDTPLEVVIVVAPNDLATKEGLLARARKVYLPNRMFTVVDAGAAVAEKRALIGLARDKRAIGGRTTAYVCRRRVCELPTSDPDRFAHELLTVGPPPSM